MRTEYITKEQAIAAAKRGIRISVNSFISTKEEIEAIKAADVRPVVLCRDCKHYNTDYEPKCVHIFWTYRAGRGRFLSAWRTPGGIK